MSGTEKDIWCDDGRPMCRHGGRSHSLNVLCPDDEPTPDRHPKWQRVEPGTVIPAGQPHAIQYENHSVWCTWAEYTRPTETVAGWRANPQREWEYPDRAVSYFIDSSWKPPLELPTEPTWGIAVRKVGDILGKWRREGDQFVGYGNRSHYGTHVDDVLDFIPLTDEQVARIEAAR